jgi:hypothetical protein
MSGLTDAALHSLLALIRLSWRFDPEGGTWVHTGKSLTRADIEEACGLSGQGTRQGLSDLETSGWVEVDRLGRSYQYKLTLGVPSRRYTYLPTGLLEEASSFASTTALRVLLVVFRKTWGWTEAQTDSETGDRRAVHKRWARASKADLTQTTGRSETAIGQAIEALEGSWISRRRPDPGAHLYRVRKEALRPERGHEEETPKTCASNEMPPYRQRSDPPSFNREFSRDEQSRKQKKTESPEEEGSQPQRSRESAVPAENSPQPGAQSTSPGLPEGCHQDKQFQQENDPDAATDFSGLSAEEQTLAEKLLNVGIWAQRAKECLSRYSLARVEANFQLWRRRKNDPESPQIKNDGAFLCEAITNGYANTENQSVSDSPEAEPSSDLLTTPNHKQKVSPEEKKRLLRTHPEIEASHFHRFRHGDTPTEKQFLYLDPASGGPTRRPSARRQAEASSGDNATSGRVANQLR